MIEPMDILELYSLGIVSGIIISIIPYIVGAAIGLAIKLLKGE